MQLSFEKKMMLLFSAIIAGVIAAGLAAFKNNEDALKAGAWVKHTQQVLYNSELVLSSAHDLESGSRGYIITGDSAFLYFFDKARQNMYSRLDSLKLLTSDNPAQQSRIDSLNKWADKRVVFSEQSIGVRAKEGLQPAQKLVATGVGKSFMDSVRSILENIRQEERRLLLERETAYLKSEARFKRSFFLLLGILLLLLLVTLFTIRHYVHVKEEAELKLTEFKHFFNHSYDLNCIANTEGYFEIINPSFEKTLGYLQSELTLNPFLHFVHPDDMPATLQAYDELISGAHVINFTNRYRKKDGEYLYIEWNASPSPVNGKLYCVARDITERKEFEMNLRAANAALEAFSYSVSHDLKAPARTIVGFTKIIQKEYASSFVTELQQLFEHIAATGKRMTEIIEDMLTLAKYEKEKLCPEPVDMKKLFSNAWDNIQFANPHQAVLQLQELPLVHADASMMEQVVVNLLTNAIKYSSKKEQPVVSVGFEKTETGFTFNVNDNGAGFDMKFYDKLFGAFQRLHGSTDFEGTGVGLLLVKRIIERHNGIVWAEGKVNEGATFYFTLPHEN